MKRFFPPQSQVKWLFIGFGAAALLMEIVNGISYQNANQLIESTNRSRKTYETIRNLVEVFAEMTVAESGRRGYIFLDDQTERLRYQVALRKIRAEVSELTQQLADHPEQLVRLDRLKVLLNQRIQLLEESMRLYQRDRTAMAMQRSITSESVLLRGKIQAVIAEMQEAEDRALQQWLSQTQQSIQQRIVIEFLIACLSFAVLAIGCWLIYRQLLKQQTVETARQVLEQEKELSELKWRFFSMVSHEFRTPLSIISGSAQMLAENNPDWSTDRRLKNIHRIQSSARLMTQYLTDILTLTRAEAGNLDCHPAPLDVEAFCLNLIEDLQFSAPTVHPLTFHSPASLGLVYLDEKLLFSILSNLLLNAMKYSAADATIQLRLQGQPDGIVFEVTDTGPGITPGDQPHLYTPFYRGANSAEVEGTGLGLVVVKKCVELHGGDIWVESQVGVGTTFRVWLPQPQPSALSPSRSVAS